MPRGVRPWRAPLSTAMPASRPVVAVAGSMSAIAISTPPVYPFRAWLPHLPGRLERIREVREGRFCLGCGPSAPLPDRGILLPSGTAPLHRRPWTRHGFRVSGADRRGSRGGRHHGHVSDTRGDTCRQRRAFRAGPEIFFPDVGDGVDGVLSDAAGRLGSAIWLSVKSLQASGSPFSPRSPPAPVSPLGMPGRRHWAPSPGTGPAVASLPGFNVSARMVLDPSAFASPASPMGGLCSSARPRRAGRGARSCPWGLRSRWAPRRPSGRAEAVGCAACRRSSGPCGYRA